MRFLREKYPKVDYIIKAYLIKLKKKAAKRLFFIWFLCKYRNWDLLQKPILHPVSFLFEFSKSDTTTLVFY